MGVNNMPQNNDAGPCNDDHLDGSPGHSPR